MFPENTGAEELAVPAPPRVVGVTAHNPARIVRTAWHVSSSKKTDFHEHCLDMPGYHVKPATRRWQNSLTGAADKAFTDYLQISDNSFV
jgi:hypothetical protein